MVKKNLNLLRKAKKGAERVGDILTAIRIQQEIEEIQRFYIGEDRWVN